VQLTATGTTSWSYAIASSLFPASDTYVVRAYATDAAGNVTQATNSFVFDKTAPTTSDISTTNIGGGTTGTAEQGDTVTLTYSEPMAPSSILAGWTGSSTNTVVRIVDGGGANDVLTVYDSTNTTLLALGSVSLGSKTYVTGDVTFGATGTASTMVQSGSAITITFGTVSNAANVGNQNAAKGVVWAPSTTATDPYGNACTTATVNKNLIAF
jgi:hypothetical protein